jgi:hypothetical protein
VLGDAIGEMVVSVMEEELAKNEDEAVRIEGSKDNNRTHAVL